jgi:hypothetical protein
MLYEPEWLRLSYVLMLVMAAGVDEVSAKRAICDVISDRKIAVRLYFLVPPMSFDGLSRRELSARYARKISKIPLHLTPRDFDWTQSRIQHGVGKMSEVRWGPMWANGRSSRLRATTPATPCPNGTKPELPLCDICLPRWNHRN